MPSPFVSPKPLQVQREEITVTATDITNGYVSLAVAAIIPNSITAFVDRAGIFEDIDFTVDLSGAYVKLVFIGSLLPGGAEALAPGDLIRVSYFVI